MLFITVIIFQLVKFYNISTKKSYLTVNVRRLFEMIIKSLFVIKIETLLLCNFKIKNIFY